MLNTFITYEAVHKLGRVSQEEAYRGVCGFLEVLTNLPRPQRRNLCLDLRTDRTVELQRLIWKLKTRFGPFPKVEASRPVRGRALKLYRWEIAKRKIAQTIVLVQTLQEKDPDLCSRLFLQETWNFRFSDPATKVVLPGQDELPDIDIRYGQGSFLQVTLTKPPAISVRFMFPFQAPNPAFQEYAKRVQSSLPVLFTNENWRLWHLSKDNNWFSRRLQVGLAA